MHDEITVIGGGLAGSEAAWQIARLGARVRLYEMRPGRSTPAHRTDRLAEIVCSNSLKSDQPYHASCLLKEELRRLGSILIRIADSVRVPAGSALAVDRQSFAERVTEVISSEPNVNLIREEVPEIPNDGIVIIASGPLTSPSLSESIRSFCSSEHLYFYDAISPIIDAETIDHAKVYRGSRYGKAADDYLNCPMEIVISLTVHGAIQIIVGSFAISARAIHPRVINRFRIDNWAYRIVEVKMFR